MTIEKMRPFVKLAKEKVARDADENSRPQGSPPPEDEQTPGHDDDVASTPPNIEENVTKQEREELDEHPIERSYHIAKSDVSKRYTLGPLYVPDHLDAHGEFTNADNMEDGTWEYVRTGNRDINLQHTAKRAGEWVGLLSWPYPVEVKLTVPGEIKKERKVKFPPGTPFMGIVWDDWAWEEYVVPGKIRGISMEGFATRMIVDEEA